MRYLTIIVAGVLVGCGRQEQVTQSVTPEAYDMQCAEPKSSNPWMSGRVYICRLPGGTVCVFHHRGGVDCDFPREEPEVEARAQTLEFGWVQN